MKLVFIGTGSAFTVGGNFHSNMYFENESSNKFLIDCGSDTRHALYELGIDHNDFDAVYISHLHADHIGGLEWLAYRTKFDPKNPKKLKLIPGLWSVLSGGLSSLDNVEPDLSQFFNVQSFQEEEAFIWEGTEFCTFQTIHQISNNKLMPSFGLEALIDNKRVLLTTDTRFPHKEDDPLRKKYEQADIIFHDCETSKKKSTVHAHYSELVGLSPEIKRKMWLYHYQPGTLPDAIKDGFRGFVRKGQSFDFTDEKTLQP